MKHIIITLIAVLLLAQIPIVKELLARGATSLYVSVKYPEQTVAFEHFEYEPHFGSYFISYTSPEGPLHLMLEPDTLPIFVSFDPWDQPVSD